MIAYFCKPNEHLSGHSPTWGGGGPPTEVTWKQTQLTLFTQLLLPQTAEEKMLQLLQVPPL